MNIPDARNISVSYVSQFVFIRVHSWFQEQVAESLRMMNITVVTIGFPRISETFVLNHIVGLIQLGHNVRILAQCRETMVPNMHGMVQKYGLLERCVFHDEIVPKKRFKCVVEAIDFIARHLLRSPRRVARAVNVFRFGRRALSLTYLHYARFFWDTDVVHCHFGTSADYWVLLKGLLPNIGFYVSFHGGDIREGIKRGGELYAEVFRKSDRVFCTTKNARHALVSLGCPEAKIERVPNGIDTDLFRPGTEGSQGLGFHVVTVARLEREKNLAFALHVIKSLSETIADLRYTLIGDGSLRMQVQENVDRLGLRNVVNVPGAKSQVGVVAALQTADAFYLPSVEEAFGLCLVEAQACGVPVVAHNVGGVSEALRPGESGILLEGHDVEAAANALRRLYNDPLRAADMGRSGRRFAVENYGVMAGVNQLVAIYRKAHGIP